MSSAASAQNLSGSRMDCSYTCSYTLAIASTLLGRMPRAPSTRSVLGQRPRPATPHTPRGRLLSSLWPPRPRHGSPAWPSCSLIPMQGHDPLPAAALEIALLRNVLLPVDLAARVALPKDLDSRIVVGLASLPGEPSDTQDEAGDHESPEQEHHEHHPESPRAPHPPHRMHLPSLPRAGLNADRRAIPRQPHALQHVHHRLLPRLSVESQ